MTGQLPPPDSIAAALVVLGLLFALRYWLALRRIGRDVPRPAPWRAPQRGDFGEDIEPNRRYAARQYWQAAVFLVAGLMLFGWVLATGMPITMGRGM